VSEHLDEINDERLRLLAKKYARGACLSDEETERLAALTTVVEMEIPRVTVNERLSLIEARLSLLEDALRTKQRGMT
jgi:hypothetical protein